MYIMKKLIIVGAGIAGLTAGVYARQSGFETTIYEAHTIPGGASTSWRRKGYLFEGGMHWLTGSSPKTALNKLWKEVGALNSTTAVYNRDPFHIYEEGGRRVCLYRDADKLKSHLLEISPEDEKEIKALCRDIKRFAKVDMPITDIKGVKVKNKSGIGVFSLLSMLPAFRRMPFYGGQTSGEYAMRYKNEFLRKLLKDIVGEENSASGLVFTLATLCSGDGGYPAGGSLGMAGRIAEKFISLGGDIKYGKAVEKVMVKNGAAVGILVNGEEIRADAVIVTQDTLAAIDQLFDKPLREPWADKMRKETLPTVSTFISLGIKADLSDVPESVGFPINTPIYCGNEKVTSIGINNYAGYQGYAPEGSSTVTSIIMGDTYDWWKSKKEDGTYEEEKQRLAEAFIAALSEKYPQIKNKVEVWDVATPLTYERYLHSYKGSWMSVMGKGAQMEAYPSKPETIKGLYFAGQRLLVPGGLPVAAETGRKAVQYLCLNTGTVFQGKL